MPKGELTTKNVVIHALQHGKEVYVPYVYRVVTPTSEGPASMMDMVSLHSQEDFQNFEPDTWGIPTPSKFSIADRKRCLGENSHDEKSLRNWEGGMQHLDMIILPGMAFDREFARLGHGKGYYDFFLTRYQRALDKAPSPKHGMPFLGKGRQATDP